MAEQPNKPPSWWLTLPGLLTALAALITAVTGSAVALHQIGGPSGREAASRENPAAVTADDKPPPASPETPAADPSGGGTKPLALPAGMEVEVGDGPNSSTIRDAAYKILSARLEARPYTEQRTLKFTVRLTATGPSEGGLGFSLDTFRLLVDGVPREPTSSPTEVVAGGSAKEGDVVFEVPTKESRVVLQIGSYPDPGEDMAKIPFDLPAAKS